MNSEGPYAVFEFQWRTNTSFREAANDLALAIDQISRTSRKKVHIVAHSFGGLLARTYLQNFANKMPYRDDVRSLVTVGTPHSGIFDKETPVNDVFEGMSINTVFPKGQDSHLFEGCLQSSCNQAGEPVSALTKMPQLVDLLDIDKEPGRIVKLLAMGVENGGRHRLPVDTNVLIGLAIDKDNFSLFKSENKVKDGDGLITYEGQRFHPSLRNGAINGVLQNVSDINGVSIQENLLGLENGVVPGQIVDKKSNFKHNNLMVRGFGDEPEVEVSDKEHETYRTVLNWLNEHGSQEVDKEDITLNVVVEDELTGLPVEDAVVVVATGNSVVLARETTDVSGYVKLTLPFYPDYRYRVFVFAEGYNQSGQTIYVSGETVEKSDRDIPRLFLLPADAYTRGSVEGDVVSVFDKRPVSGVEWVLERNGIVVVRGKTDSEGGYRATGLVPGKYILRVRKEGFKDAVKSLFVEPGQVVAGGILIQPVDWDRWVYGFAVDYIKIDGNINGSGEPDGTYDYIDDFDDNSLLEFPTGRFRFLPGLTAGTEEHGFRKFDSGKGVHLYRGDIFNVVILDSLPYAIRDGYGNTYIEASFRADHPEKDQWYYILIGEGGKKIDGADYVGIFVLSDNQGTYVYAHGENHSSSQKIYISGDGERIRVALWFDDQRNIAYAYYWNQNTKEWISLDLPPDATTMAPVRGGYDIQMGGGAKYIY